MAKINVTVVNRTTFEDFMYIVLSRENKILSKNVDVTNFTIECPIGSFLLVINRDGDNYYLFNSFVVANNITDATINITHLRNNILLSDLEVTNNSGRFKQINRFVKLLQCGFVGFVKEFVQALIDNVDPPPNPGIPTIPDVTPEIPRDTNDINDLWWILIPITGVVLIIIVLIIVFFLLDKKQYVYE